MMPAKPRVSQHITNKNDVDYILSLKDEDFTSLSVITKMFGSFKGKQRFHTYDTIDIPPGSYGPEGHKNKNTFITTLGRYVWNKVFIENILINMKPYYNETINKKMFKKLNRDIAHARLEDKITIEQLKAYLLRTQKMMPLVTILMENETEAFYELADKIKIKKKELLKKYDKEIKAGHDDIVPKMEKELIEYGKEVLGDDGSLDVFENGESADYGNNFKNLFVMKGLVKRNDPAKGGYNIITSDYMTGVSKDEYSMFADSLAAGPYARSNKTAVGGYWEKLFRVLEHVVLDEPGTDCHTKRTIEITLSPDMIDYVMYGYIVEGNKLIELTSENESKYLNKTVRMRFLSLCEHKNGKICSKCAGNKFYRLGMRNIGSTTPQVASKLKNINMKSFHDSQVSFVEMDPMKAFFPFGMKGKQVINEDVNDYGIKTETVEQQILHENSLIILNSDMVFED